VVQRTWWLPVILTASLIVPLSPSVRADELTKSRMKGITGVYVYISRLSNDATEAGLSSDQIQTSIELRIRQSGIPILTKDEWLKYSTAGCFVIDVGVMKNLPLPIYSIQSEFDQLALLTTPPTVPVLAATWRSGSYGRGGIDDIRRVIDDQVSDFLNKFLEANPKK
jgi:hypothetical protein